eukprot:5037830-Pleurochrysis_carterae.AAC.3
MRAHDCTHTGYTKAGILCCSPSPGYRMTTHYLVKAATKPREVRRLEPPSAFLAPLPSPSQRRAHTLTVLVIRREQEDPPSAD